MRAVVFRVLLIVATLVTIVVVGLGLVRHFATPAARKASGGNDFMPVWRPSVDYARAHEGRFPPLDVEAGRLMIDRRLMHEEFELSGQEVTADFDPSVPVDHGDYDDSPEHRANADLIDDHSWWYLGYRATNDDEGRAFLLGYLRAVLTNMSFGETLPVPEHGGLNPVPRVSLDA